MEESQRKFIEHLAANGTRLGPKAVDALQVMTESFETLTKERDELRKILQAANETAARHVVRVTSLESAVSRLEREVADREEGLEVMRKKLAALATHERGLAQTLSEKELQIQRDRADLHAQFADREEALRREIQNQQSSLVERETASRLQRQQLLERTKLLEDEHIMLRSELKQRVTEHEKAIADLIRQREQYEAEFQERMESKATEYVDTALGSLRTSEERFDSIGSKWAYGGLLGVIIGLVLAYFLTTEATEKIVSNKDISWSLILFFGVKGAVLLGLVVAMVRLCMRLARNYMHESLKTAERRHAINYGKFYLSLYGAGTEGEKLKDVFAHWNISTTSAFAEKDDPITQPSMGEIGEFAKTLIGLKKELKDGDKD